MIFRLAGGDAIVRATFPSMRPIAREEMAAIADERAPAPAPLPAPPVWKTSMIVLLCLYPLVFSFDLTLVPALEARGAGMWLALFASNVSCVVMLALLIPWVSRRFDWWLMPRRSPHGRTDVLGAAVLIALYGLLLLTFAWVSRVTPGG